MKRTAETLENPEQVCVICCESFTREKRSRVNCPSCDFSSCASCNKSYLLNLDDDPKCMNCNFAWNASFLDSVFSKTWLDGEFSRAREKVLFDRERAMLPDSQHLVANFNLAQNIKKTIEEEKEERKRLQERIESIDRNKYRLQNQFKRIRESHYQVDGTTTIQPHQVGGDNPNDPGPSGATFICPCPVEECRGFLDSLDYKCGICNTYACKECREVIGNVPDAPHKCNEETLKTVKLLTKDSKPCPSCGATIYKIDGCDQMWCTNCRTPFSWRTGQIVTSGTLHNPHYFEYMRKQGNLPRQPGDAPCGGENPLSAGRLRAILGYDDPSHLPRVRAMRNVLWSIAREFIHIRATALGGIRVPHDSELLNLRRKYLLNMIDEDTWKRNLVLRERRKERAQAMVSVYEMVLDVARDIYAALDGTEPSMEKAIEELDNVCSYASEHAARIAARYSSNIPINLPCIKTVMANHLADYEPEFDMVC